MIPSSPPKLCPSDCDRFWRTHVPKLIDASRQTSFPLPDCTAHFEIIGSGGGDWSVIARMGQVEEVRNAALGDASIRVSLSVDTFLAIARGDLDHREAFFRRRVRIAGNLILALSLSNYIPELRARFPFASDVSEEVTP